MLKTSTFSNSFSPFATCSDSSLLFTSPSLRTHLIVHAGWIHGYWIKYPKSNKNKEARPRHSCRNWISHAKEYASFSSLCYPKYSRQPRDQSFIAGIHCHIHASFSIPFTKKDIFCWFSLFFNALCLWVHTCKGHQGHTNCTWHWPPGVLVLQKQHAHKARTAFSNKQTNKKNRRYLASFYVHFVKDSSLRHHYVTRAEISCMPRRTLEKFSSPPRKLAVGQIALWNKRFTTRQFSCKETASSHHISSG